jgi:anti-sigma B factor antagonist
MQTHGSIIPATRCGRHARAADSGPFRACLERWPAKRTWHAIEHHSKRESDRFISGRCRAGSSSQRSGRNARGASQWSNFRSLWRQYRRRSWSVVVSNPSVLTLAERRDGNATVLSAEGIVDMAAAPVLTDQIRAILRQRPSVLVVDFSAVTFLATAGMSVLMEAHRKCEELAISFRVVAHGPITVKPMQLLGIHDLLAIYPTVSAALHGVPPGGH